jgi:hypothetical protein
MIVYISIGNSDDKLTQADWSLFQGETDRLVNLQGGIVHGVWSSNPWSKWQNACWCVELPQENTEPLKKQLQVLAAVFSQDSIAWAEVRDTEFLGAHSG